MALKFFNINSGETRVANSAPQIAALWASSDRGPNVSQGQDFGWRLAAEIVVELKRIAKDYATLEKIAVRYRVLLQDVDEKLILKYISDNTRPQDAVDPEKDYQEEYENEIRRLEGKPQRGESAASEDSKPQSTATKSSGRRAATKAGTSEE